MSKLKESRTALVRVPRPTEIANDLGVSQMRVNVHHAQCQGIDKELEGLLRGPQRLAREHDVRRTVNDVGKTREKDVNEAHSSLSCDEVNLIDGLIIRRLSPTSRFAVADVSSLARTAAGKSASRRARALGCLAPLDDDDEDDDGNGGMAEEVD